MSVVSLYSVGSIKAQRFFASHGRGAKSDTTSHSLTLEQSSAIATECFQLTLSQHLAPRNKTRDLELKSGIESQQLLEGCSQTVRLPNSFHVVQQSLLILYVLV